ncbi:MAG: hypothetical protein HY070_08605 [Chloroflexi bacterium]|nr:hypothetical protein [Chloroflexota bacterium]
MEQSREIEIPIICETNQCENYGKIVNVVRGIRFKDLDLFYENFDDSVEQDKCPICGELGVAEDPILVKGAFS